MQNGDKTMKHFKIAAVKDGTHSHVADEIVWGVTLIDGLRQWKFRTIFPTIQECSRSIVGNQISQMVEIYLWTSVEINSLKCCGINDVGKQ
jgi:hypothetical protein